MLAFLNAPVDAIENNSVLAFQTEVPDLENGSARHEGLLAGERDGAKRKFACGGSRRLLVCGRTTRLMKKTILSSLFVAATIIAPEAGASDKKLPGYTDTPMIPGQKWRVHDANRPRPEVVKVGPSKTLGLKPPKGAVVLFNGKDTSQWNHNRWKVENGYMEVTRGGGQLSTKKKFGSVKIHLEFATPAKVAGSSQGRGNSGLFFCGQYEVQVLDSYNNISYADGQCAALYGQFPPDLNACRPPGEWQTYDIEFRIPKFGDDGKVLRPATVTVFHNGVKVHDKREMIGPTGHKSVKKYRKHGPGPIGLQDHGNPMRFRNIWVEELED